MEHDGETIPEDDSDSQHSAQTNEVIEGYEEANASPGSVSRVYLNGEEQTQPRGSLFEDEYKLLSRKFSFNSKNDDSLLIEDQEGEEIDELQYLKMRKQQVMETFFLDHKNPYRL